MIAGFTQSYVTVSHAGVDTRLSVHRAGQGTPLILLHGYPQNHHCWEKVAPTLAQHFDVIVPDLRGYGDSDAPHDNDAPIHSTYSKQRMALDICGLMDVFGIARTHVLGHDRGGRVAYRFALDHPDRLLKLGIVEIVPTLSFWDHWTADLAMKAYHWTFLAQPEPLPERMINADPEAYVLWSLKQWTLSKSLDAFSAAALDSYRAQSRDPARIHAMCADYRSGATYDRALDTKSRNAGQKITAPLHFLYGESGFPAQTGDPLAIWRTWAAEVTGGPCVSGHFTIEENPQAVLDAFVPFFSN